MIKRLTLDQKIAANKLIHSSTSLEELMIKLDMAGIHVENRYEVSYYILKFGGRYFEYAEMFGTVVNSRSKNLLINEIDTIVDEKWVKNVIYNAWTGKKTNPHDRFLVELWLSKHQEWSTGNE